MSFSSLDFLIFFILVLSVTAILERYLPERIRIKEIWLLLASYFFYGYWDWRFCFLLLFVTLTAYITARYGENSQIYVVGILIPLLVLGVFKYFNFFLESASAVLGQDLGTLRIILPVGISFYTFQALSYVMDVHRGKLPVEEDFIRLALYISFFPQLVAGPIVRAADFLPQLREKRRVTWEGILWGVQVFAFGLFKKIVLADHLSVFVDDIYGRPAAFHWTTLVLAAVSYSIQIYLDFSGYSDMAIGCARCLGYDFQRNFNLPYLSESVTEFWRRWHISLSTWLKEYLYIPLGGNRKGKRRQYVNLFLTMLLGGLWHGASWTFVFWGGLNGLALCLDKIRIQADRKKDRAGAGQATASGFASGKKSMAAILGRGLRVLGTFCFITFTWVFFRADSFSSAGTYLQGIVTLQSGIRQPFLWSFVALVILCLCTLTAEFRGHGEQSGGEKSVSGFYPILDLRTVLGLTIFFVEVGLILGLAFTGENPFVYFQF